MSVIKHINSHASSIRPQSEATGPTVKYTDRVRQSESHLSKIEEHARRRAWRTDIELHKNHLKPHSTHYSVHHTPTASPAPPPPSPPTLKCTRSRRREQVNEEGVRNRLQNIFHEAYKMQGKITASSMHPRSNKRKPDTTLETRRNATQRSSPAAAPTLSWSWSSWSSTCRMTLRLTAAKTQLVDYW